MKTSTAFSTALVAAVLILGLGAPGCGGEKKTPPVPVGTMQEYRDPGFGFRLKYPDGWVSNSEVGRARFYNARDIEKKFLDPMGDAPNGVVIGVTTTVTTSPDSERDREIADMTKIGIVVGKQEPVTLDGKNGLRVPYSAHYSQNVVETGEHLYFSVDTLLYDLQTAGFSDLFQAYKGIFDSSIHSFQFPKPVPKGRDATLPSEIFTQGQTKSFSYEYPENFNFESVPKKENEEAVSLRGENRSCSIQFLVFAAKGLTLQKVFDQNKGSFKGAVSGKATIGGQPALTLTYGPTRDVERRFYFVVRNDKVYRVTMDWVRAQRSDYLAAYEKVLNSIKFK